MHSSFHACGHGASRSMFASRQMMSICQHHCGLGVWLSMCMCESWYAALQLVEQTRCQVGDIFKGIASHALCYEHHHYFVYVIKLSLCRDTDLTDYDDAHDLPRSCPVEDVYGGACPSLHGCARVETSVCKTPQNPQGAPSPPKGGHYSLQERRRAPQRFRVHLGVACRYMR